MSYLVLARKYRPKNFTQMVGQEHVVRALMNALDSQRLHHAYLFTGTRGVGKTTVARILAKSLNCLGVDGRGGITSAPCGVCQACTDIDSGRFIDYTELDAASNRGIDDVQTLLEQAVYKPVQGRFKVFMVDEVHMLTGPAFNAMLKTLEEPPDYLKFVLATTDPQKVPVTVLSRCLQFNLRPMAPDTIREHLSRVLADEGVSADLPSLRLLSRAARGSMRDALSLTDQAIAFGAGRIEEASVQAMLGSVDRGHVFRLIEALAAADGKTVVHTVDELRVNGLNAASALDQMGQVLQQMAVLQAVPEAADESDPDAAVLRRLAGLMPPDETQLLYSMCLQGRAELALAPDEYAGLVMVLLRLLAFKPAPRAVAAAEKKTLIEAAGPATASGGGALARVPAAAAAAVARVVVPDAASAALPAAPAPAANRPAAMPSGQVLPVRANPHAQHVPADANLAAAVAWAEPVPPPTGLVQVPVRIQTDSAADAVAAGRNALQVLVPTEEGDFWHQTVTQLVGADAISAMPRELALQSQLVARDTDQWLLRVDRESLNQTGSRERLATALGAAGYPVALAVEIGRVSDSPARRNAAAAAERQLAAERTIFEDPFVQSMMRDFGAKIVPGSIKPL
ncbi:MAG: DNA polymerase III subunit gamma/tau [Rhodoferax sp.]|nr:DNA polymerase III subunit gamma/tau [Rhodoferax sp.]